MHPTPGIPPLPTLHAREVGAGPELVLRVTGPLTHSSLADLWRQTESTLEGRTFERLVVDASAVESLDGTGLAWLLKLRCLAATLDRPFAIHGLDARYHRLLERFPTASYRGIHPSRPTPERLPDQVGRVTARMWSDFRQHLEFIGELADTLVRSLLRPRTIRGRDLLLAAERTGADAVPIVGLISGLVGLVLAFQSAMAMRPYGAEIYVANLVTIAMLRELGPLMTAIILAGRSGAAYAAEIGTMKVNDEVAALSTMGLDVVRFLAVPRVLAMVITMPLLVVFANLVGILGGAAMFLSLDYPISAYFDQCLDAAETRHLLSGLVKSVAFGFTIAGVGCLRGLQTLRGPSAVGQSATSAVVTAILLVVVLDAVLGTVFYFLGF